MRAEESADLGHNFPVAIAMDGVAGSGNVRYPAIAPQSARLTSDGRRHDGSSRDIAREQQDGARYA